MVKKRPQNIQPQPIQNESSGYKYFYTTDNENEKYPMQEGWDIAVDAITKFNLDFGCVDIMWDKDKNEWLILEINTAFGLGEKNAETVAEELYKLVLEKIKEIRR